MKSLIIENFINSRKMAVLKNGKLNKLIIDENFSNNKINNIYRGRIEKFEKSLGAAFVDIGEKNSVYLEISRLPENVAVGDNVLIQILKEEKGEKRAVATTEISISGRYVVYIPSSNKISYSNKIKDKSELENLKEKAVSILGGKKGYIFRTKSVDVGIEELKSDIDEVENKYGEILKKFNLSFKPCCIYKPDSKIQDFLKNAIEEFSISIDSGIEKNEVSIDKIVYSVEDDYHEDFEFHNFVKNELKKKKIDFSKVIFKERGVDVFESYGINTMLKKYLARKVWFEKGVHIVIDKTEAMTVIDVNSGRFTGNGSIEDMKLNANLAAANEICDQIVMRDISGIIIVDFIDMKSIKNKQEVMNRVIQNLENDDRKFKVHGFTSLGLLEISRMRKGNTLEDYYLYGGIPDSKSTSAIIDGIERSIIFSKYHLGNKKEDTVKYIGEIFFDEKNEFNFFVEKILEKYYSIPRI